MLSSNPIIGKQYREFIQYVHTNHIKTMEVEDTTYDNVCYNHIVIVNTRNYPITFWVGKSDRSTKYIPPFKEVNGSNRKITMPKILESKEALEFKFIIDYSPEGKKEQVKEGYVYVVTSEGTIPIDYKC